MMKRMMRNFVTIVSYFLCVTLNGAQQPKDVSFQSLARQSDGALVAAGYMHDHQNGQMILARYTSSGSLDTSFGANGIVSTLLGSESEFFSVKIQADGKLVAVGRAKINGENNWAIVRYNTDGTTQGTITQLINNNEGIAYDLALQLDGKIVVIGQSTSSLCPCITLVRYLSNGTIDTTFGTNGIVTTSVGKRSVGRSVVIQPDGKIVVGGYAMIAAGQTEIALIRYNSNGSPDTSFGSNGVVQTQVGERAVIEGITLDGTNIVVAGQAFSAGIGSMMIARYTTTGSLDMTFNTTGIVTTQEGNHSGIFGLTIAGSSRILVAGFSDQQPHVMLYNQDGTLNRITKISLANEAVGKAVLIAAGKPVVVGNVADSSFLARLNGDGTFDTSFANRGWVINPIGSVLFEVTLIWDQKSSGVHGGDFNANAWRTRDLNMIDGDQSITLSNNQFTLPEGTYKIRITAPAYQVDQHQARLYNVTDSVTEKVGSSTHNASLTSSNVSIIEHVLSLTKDTTFELQHKCAQTATTSGFGLAANLGEDEIYTQIRIRKLF